MSRKKRLAPQQTAYLAENKEQSKINNLGMPIAGQYA